MKSTSAIHPAITENTENILVKRTPHISIRESHNASISPMSNPFHNIRSKQGIVQKVSQQFLCLTLKPLRVYLKSSPCAVVKKDQRGTKVAP